MSFLARFENKISTVTMHGTLRHADGVEEVRSGPMRKKPQPAQLLLRQPDNNRDHHPPAFDDDGRDNDDHDGPHVVKTSFKPYQVVAQQPQPLAKQPSPRKSQPQPHAPSPKKTFSTPVKPAKPPHADDSAVRGSNDHPKQLATNEDQLAFSKKARPVAYEPCTLTEYRQEKHDKYYELGKLQPDLNSSELVEKRANQERIKEFSKNLRQINQAIPKKAAPDDKAAPKALSTRDKALAFAKQKVPKPKIRKMPSPVSVKAAPVRKGRAVDVDNDVEREGGAIDDGAGATSVMTELQQLQLKHRAARAQVEALMRDS
ncbi:hypothetical protein DYB32_006721 [Aphanomyces invadans]|uniref:Uncharacterized protein n=1 Tax=Aphanomyces invadans TaxID=157072 RepID=A0A418AQM5_9STRA|nr:hypothetical protein DYB32_006721 [Aphanomyces invadans]